MKIVFFGTPEFAVASLKKLVDNDIDIAAVVTAPDKAAGRGHKLLQSDVKKFAVERGLRVLQPEKLKNEEFLTQLREINADLFIVIAFRMLPKEVWQMPRLGTFNLHGSLLPKYRGAAPINRAVMNGDKVTGVTTFFLKHEIDTGDIIDSQSIEIGPDENVGSVYDRLMEIGADMTLQTVRAIEKGTVKTHPQPEGDFTPAPKIFAEDMAIDWSRTAQEIHNQVRGLAPYPGARSTIIEATGRPIDIKVLETRLIDESNNLRPGEVSTDGKRLIVGTSEGCVEILTLQPSGKKAMETRAFLLGYKPSQMR